MIHIFGGSKLNFLCLEVLKRLFLHQLTGKFKNPLFYLFINMMFAVFISSFTGHLR